MGPKFLRQGYQYIDTVGEEAPQTHDHVPQELLVTPLEMQVLGAFELLAHATQVGNCNFTHQIHDFTITIQSRR